MMWEKIRLGESVSISKGKKHNPVSYGKHRYINIEDLHNPDNSVFTNELGQFVSKNDVIIAWDGANAGKVGIGLSGVIGSTLAKMVLKIQNLDPSFLFWFLESKNGIIKSQRTGATIPHVNGSALKDLQIPLPPLPIQKRIAEILDTADALRRKDEALLKKYDELAQAIFIDMFGDPVKNEKGWEVKKLGECIEYIGDIGSNGSNDTISKNLEMSDSEGYAIMIRTTNLNANNFENNLKYVSKKTYDLFSKSQIFGGEIIMNKIGSAGDFWIMPDLNKPVSLGLNQLVIRLKNLNTKYLYYYLSTNYGKAVIKSSINGAVTKSITKSAVKELPLLYPKLELQNKFSEIINLIEKQKETSKAKKTTNLFNSLLQKASNGELVS